MKIEILINGKKEPIGLDAKNVRVLVSTEEIKDIEKFSFFIYNKNGLIFSKQTKANLIYIPSGKLNYCTEYFCKVEVKCAHCIEKFYAETSFETGLNGDKVIGQWIENPKFNQNVSEFIKYFTINDSLRKCRLYIVGLGFYQSKINGKQTDEYFFKPLLTDFDVRENLKNDDYDEKQFNNGKKTVCYDAFDITNLVVKGENSIEVQVGTGWYCNLDKTVTDPSFSFGTPKLFFEIHAYYDEKKEVFCSDENCNVRNLPISSQLFYGDKVDFTANLEEYSFVKKASAPKSRLIPSTCAHDKIFEELSPIKESKETCKYEYDFGKNHTGSLNLRVKGKRNTKITIKYYEVKSDGKLNINTGSCGLFDRERGEFIGVINQTSEYVLSGNVDEIYPLFHWNCYRYATIETNDDSALQILEIKSLFITSDIVQDGKFCCSNEFLNKLYDTFILTQRDNMHCGVPSDCPHREKLPYTGDGQLCMQSVLNIFDAETFYRKWLKDIVASQRADGWIPYTAPYIAGGGGCWWSNALLVVALNLYRYTGDEKILKEVLEPAKKLLSYYANSHNGNYVITKKAVSWMLGDWLAPSDTISNKDLINTLAYYYAVSETLRLCKILGEKKYALKLTELKSNIANAINDNFFDCQTIAYGDGAQGENLLPLLFDIVPKEFKAKLEKKIIEHYTEFPYFDTGVVLTPVLLDALVELGEEKLAFDILTRKEYPSLNCMLEGETTLCESWDKENNKYLSDVSRCHPMFGSVVAWVVKYVAGLDITNLHKKEIIFSPKFTAEVKKCYAEKITYYGLVNISYKNYDKLKVTLNVPFGLTGLLKLDGKLKNKKFKIIDKNNHSVTYIDNQAKITLIGGNYQIDEV